MLGEVLELCGSFLVRVGVLQTVFELEWHVFLRILYVEKKFVIDLKHLHPSRSYAFYLQYYGDKLAHVFIMW